MMEIEMSEGRGRQREAGSKYNSRVRSNVERRETVLNVVINSLDSRQGGS